MTTADEDDDARTIAALADAARLTGMACAGCGRRVCGHEAVFALVLGYKNAPRCLLCTAQHMREPAGLLRERALAYVQHHDCFHAAWRRAGEREASADAVRPCCVFGVVAAPVVAPASEPAVAPVVAPVPLADEVAARWDAGSMGCGDLVLELRGRLAALPAAAVFELRAEDPGAPIDLPAWCQMTGHTLLSAQHPVYRLRRKAGP